MRAWLSIIIGFVILFACQNSTEVVSFEPKPYAEPKTLLKNERLPKQSKRFYFGAQYLDKLKEQHIKSNVIDTVLGQPVMLCFEGHPLGSCTGHRIDFSQYSPVSAF